MPAPKKAPNPDELAAAIAKLGADEAAHFLGELERAFAKRRVQLWGYLLGLVAWLVGMLFALFYYGSADPEAFRGWIFVVPFAALGLVLWAMGALAERVGKRPSKLSP